MLAELDAGTEPGEFDMHLAGVRLQPLHGCLGESLRLLEMEAGGVVNLASEEKLAELPVQ